MSFLSPLAFLLFALSLPLALLYFLKVRRLERTVSCVLLWESSPREREASTFFRRLQRDPLLLLQILALLALTLALARPAVSFIGQGSRKIAIVMDVSASMKATDVAPSRFAAAQRQALLLVDRLGWGEEAMVIEAGIRPRVVAPLTRDRGRIRSAINGLRPLEISDRLTEALDTARSLVAGDARGEVHVFTDGALPASLLSGEANSGIRWTGVGERGRNIGITSLAVRKASFRAFDYQAFFSVVNFSEGPETFAFAVAVDDRTVAEQSLTLPPKVRRSVVVPFSHDGGGVVRVRLDIGDDLSTDNVAHAVISPPKPIRVLLVSPGNLFLEKALRTDPGVALEVRTPDDYRGGMESADVVVLDSVSPARIGAGRFVLVNTAPPDVPLEILGRVSEPVILDWDRSHPIMRHVDLDKVMVEEALRVRPLAAGKTLVETIGGPVLYALEEPRRKIVFAGFDLFKSDLPLRVAFPLILSNILRWLHPAGLDSMTLQREAGQPILLPLEHGVTSATVTTPSGRAVEARVVRGLASFSETGEAGIYTLTTTRGEARIAVNLASAEESDLAPRPLPAPARSEGSAGPKAPVQREIWPLFVFLAAALLLLDGLLYWRRRSGGWFGPLYGADRWALGLRCALVLLLLFSLFSPVAPRWVDRLNVLFLMDVSDSVSLAAREAAYRFAARSLSGMRDGDRAGLIVFGQEAKVAQALKPLTKLERPMAEVGGRGTDIARAIRLALATLPAGYANRLVLLSDGRQTAGDALAAAQTAKDAGADIHYVPLPLTFPQEVVVESLALPHEVKSGEPFQVKVVAWSQQETQGRLSLYRNGEFLGSQIVRLAAGKNVFAYRQSLDVSGVHVYQAAVEAEGDVIEENNRAVGTVVVRGRPRVLLAEKDKAHAQALAAALRSQQIDVDVAEQGRIPKELAGLRAYDGVILSNISSLALTKRQMEQIRDYVREEGGGLIMVGGEESFGLGGYYRTPIEEALPVTMEVKQKIEIPNLAVALVVDRSGSMAMSTDDKATKLDIAKEASHLVVELLDDRNEVGVMSFDTEFVWDAPLQSARNRSAIARAIATIKAGGGTDGYPALREAYRALFDSQALLKHVIFLSDGQMTRGDFAGLIRRMAKDKITVSSVAIGKDADVQLMFDVAKWGKGRFYYTEDTFTIPRIFTLETQLASKSSLVEQPFRPVVAGAHEVLQEIDWKNSPPLGGYVATTLKSSGEMLLMTHREDPLLATWRYGLGRAAAFTSDAKPKWGVLWVRWGEFNKFWSQLTRWTLRTGHRSDLVASVEQRGGVGEVTVEAINANGEFINFLEAQAGVVSPDRERSVVNLEQVAPGRYRGRFPASEEGVYLVGLAERRDGRTVGSQLAGLVVPYSQEFRALGVDEALLSGMAEIAAAGPLTHPGDAFLKGRRRSRLEVHLWPWMVGVAAVGLLADVAARRIAPGLLGRLVARLGYPRKTVGHAGERGSR